MSGPGNEMGGQDEAIGTKWVPEFVLELAEVKVEMEAGQRDNATKPLFCTFQSSAIDIDELRKFFWRVSRM